jgi:hypothetical protein
VCEGSTVSNPREALHLRTLGDHTLWCRRISEWNVAHIERCTWRNGDAIRYRIYRADIARRYTAPRKTPALPNCEPLASRVRSDDGARFVNDLTLAACRATFAQQAAIVTIWHKANLLALRLLCRDQAARSRYLANFGFRHAAEREACARNCSAIESVQEVGLILLGINSGTQSPGAPVIRDGATCIVPGGNRITAEESAPLANECAKLHCRIATNAGARGLTALIRRHKWFQDGISELLLQVLNMKRDAEMVGDATRIIGGIKGAAALPMSVALIGSAVQSHPYANDLVPSLH